MPKTCDHCGESAVEEDEQVCSSCGIVIDDITFGTEFTSFQRVRYTPLTRAGARILNKAKPKIGLTYGLSSLKNLCHVYSIPSETELELTEMLKNVYPSKRFKLKEDVGVLGGCCLFLLQRRNNQSIPINDICHQLDCTRRKFGYFLSFLKSWLAITHQNFLLNPVEEGDGIFAQCQKKDRIADPDLPERAESLIPAVCIHASEEEKDKLMKKTVELVKLANSCWLFTGRSPHSVVVACAFLCWKSLNPHRKKSSFAKFCSALKIREPVAKLRIPEIKALLLKLGRKIPSYTKDYVNEDNFLFHLDTILENSETLRNDLLPDEFCQEEINCKEFDSFRFPPKRIPRKIPESAVTYDSDMNASDIEISDSEIESYIVYNTQKKTIEDLCFKNHSASSS